MSINGLDRRDPALAALSAYVRQSNAAGIKQPLFTSDTWRAHADNHLHTPVAGKIKRLLLVVESRTAHAGAIVEILTNEIYPLLNATPPEVPFLIDALIAEGLLAKITGQPHGYTLTLKGFERLEAEGLGPSTTCFVAMSFKPDLYSAFDMAIKPAIVESGFDDVRLDRVEHSDNINDRILADIRHARFLVADFTHHPGGVYFEAGFALGLGKPVIFTCRTDHFDGEEYKAHFDTRPYNHITWTSEQDLRKKLITRIRAVVPGAKLG